MRIYQKHNPEAIFTFIRDFSQASGLAPTLDEIAANQRTSKSVIVYWLRRMEVWGWIRREKGRWRAIEILRVE